ncbi:MAG: hypothetical protein L6R43_17510 [Planctomycetes bacterium]|nr:hypothetical protein [Planctomycetota bacterium]
MRRLAAFLPAVLLAAALLPAPLLPRAAAGPSTDAFDDLLLELDDRAESLPSSGLTKEQRKWKQAIDRSFRALGADSPDLAGDLRMAGRVAKALEKGYPGDATFGALLAGALDELESLLVLGRDQLEVTASLLAEGAPRTKALARLAAADDRLEAAGDAGTATLRAKEMGRAQRFVLQGAAAAAKGEPGGTPDESTMTATVKGQPWAANSDFGTAVSGLAAVSEEGGLRRLLVRGRRILSVPADPAPLPGDESILELSLQASAGGLVPGTYPVGNVGGFSAGASWIEETEAGLVNGLAVSGSITLSTVEVKLGSVSVTGGFSLTIWDGLTGGTFTATSGLFEASDLPRTTED